MVIIFVFMMHGDRTIPFYAVYPSTKVEFKGLEIFRHVITERCFGRIHWVHERFITNNRCVLINKVQYDTLVEACVVQIEDQAQFA